MTSFLKKIADRKKNFREGTTKHGRLVVFIRHDSAGIWGFRYGLTLYIGTLKIMASTGVFVFVSGASQWATPLHNFRSRIRAQSERVWNKVARFRIRDSGLESSPRNQPSCSM
jgi:hypothetical protein